MTNKDKFNLIISEFTNYGVIAGYKHSNEDVYSAFSVLARQHNEALTGNFASHLLYNETDSKTEWVIVDRNPHMAIVHIVKRVTRYFGSDLETTHDEQYPITVDRVIANDMVALLNSQLERKLEAIS